MASRPVWMAGGCIAAATGVSAAGVWAAAAATAGFWGAATLAATFAASRVASAKLVLAGVAALAITVRALLAPGSSGAPPAPLPAGPGTWQATVEAATKSSSGIENLILAFDEPEVRCFARSPSPRAVPAGALVSVSGRIEPIPDDEFGQWLAARGIGAVCEATSVNVERTDGSPMALIERVRQASGDGLAGVLPEPAAGLASGILIGLRDRVDRDVAAAFTTAGVSHIVAISGWNIAIVAGLLAAMTKGCGRRRRTVVTLAAVVAYTLFAGASPSVVRAAAMAGVALAAREIGGRARASIALAWAVVAMLVVEPSIVSDVGFQLSAVATAGLLAWGTPLSGWLSRRLPGVPEWLRESLAVSLAAQASTLPIVLVVFGRLAVISPVVNLVAVPLVPITMATGAIALLAGLATQAGAPALAMSVLALPAWLALTALISIVRLGAAAPGASLTLAPPLNYAAAVCAAGTVVMLAKRRTGSRSSHETSPPHSAEPVPRRESKSGNRRKAAVLVSAIAIALAGCVFVGRPDGAVHVTVLDVGQGDAILLEGNRGSEMLIDGGPDAGGLVQLLDSRVPPWRRHLAAIVLTHPHDDHVAGLAAVAQRYEVDHVFETGTTAETPAYRAWEAALHDRGLAAERLAAGDRLFLDDLSLDVLWPLRSGSTRATPAGESANRTMNDTSVVLLGTFENRRFLLTGDAEDDVDPELIARGLPPVDLLKVAHHGSGTATSGALLDATRPAVALISVGADNKYGHPSEATVARLRSHGATVLRTDLSGTLDAAISSPSVGVTPERGSPDVASDRSRGSRRLLYDSADVHSVEGRGGPIAALARPSPVAPPPLAGGRGYRGMARSSRRRAPRCHRPVPRRGGRSPPRRGQAPTGESQGRLAAARRGFRGLAVATRSR